MSRISGWQTAYEIDFTQQSNQTFTSDGTYTVGGLTWTKGNSANESAHAAIVNGSGLNFQPSSSTDYNTSTSRTAPYLWLPLTQVFPNGLDYSTKLRMYVSLGSDNLANSYDNQVFGMDTNSTAFLYLSKRGYGTAGQGGQSLMAFNNNNPNNFANDAFKVASNAAAGKTWCIEFDSVLFNSVRNYRLATQLSAGTPFPALGTFQPTNMTMFTAGPEAPGTTNGTQWNTISSYTSTSLGFFLGAQRAGSSTALSIYFQRMRIDYHL